MLRFDIGRIPVGIHFSFVFILLLAYWWTEDIVDAALVGAGLLVGVVLHEMGHALTARRFGAKNVSITLFALGGVTTYPPPRGLTPGRKFLIAAAGSALALAFGIPVLLAFRADLFTNRTIELVAVGFWVATVFWGILNWVPIRPLDGGQMLTSALQIFMPERGANIAKVISIVFAAGAVIWLYQAGQEFAAIYVAFIAFAGMRDDPEPPGEGVTQAQRPQPEPRDQGPPEFPL